MRGGCIDAKAEMKLEEIQKLIAEATPGPWPCWSDPDIASQVTVDGLLRPVVIADDARFIAASRTLLPKLLRVAEAAKAFMAEGKSYDETEACHVAMEDALKDLEGE